MNIYCISMISFAVTNVKLLKLVSKTSKVSNSNWVGYLFY